MDNNQSSSVPTGQGRIRRMVNYVTGALGRGRNRIYAGAPISFESSHEPQQLIQMDNIHILPHQFEASYDPVIRDVVRSRIGIRSQNIENSIREYAGIGSTTLEDLIRERQLKQLRENMRRT